MANTSEDRSSELTKAASPSLSARKVKSDDKVVATPAAARNSQVRLSMAVIDETSFCQKAADQEMRKISTDCIANARVESISLSPALERTTDAPAAKAASKANTIHIHGWLIGSYDCYLSMRRNS